MLFRSRGWLGIFFSIILMSVAFTIQKISIVFFLQCLVIVGGSYFLHEFLHRVISDDEGIDTKCEFWPIGAILTVVSAILSGGTAVLAIPTVVKIKGKEESRWMKEKVEISAREIGLASISGPLSNLLLALGFLALYNLFGLPVLRLGALINTWIALANLIPLPPIDGAKIMSWDRWAWFLSASAGLAGLLALIV